MNTEEEVLDIVWNHIPSEYSPHLYGTRPTLPVPEMYITVNGEELS